MITKHGVAANRSGGSRITCLRFAGDALWVDVHQRLFNATLVTGVAANAIHCTRGWVQALQLASAHVRSIMGNVTYTVPGCWKNIRKGVKGSQKGNIV